MGIREILGGSGGPASWTYVGEHLRDQYIKNSNDQARRAEARKRDQYFEGGGDEYIKRLVYLAFEDSLTRKLRADLVSQTKWNNVLARVSREVATVYSEPAARRITGDDKKYQEFLELVGQDAVMREVDQKLVYHDDVWVQYRVQKETGAPVVDAISPAMFWPVCSPNDRTQMIAVVLDQTPQRMNRATPCFRVWTADETFMLDAECRVIISTIEVNSLGRIPGVLASMRPASTKGQLLTESPAADLVAAHETIWFQNILLVKESKSANRQAYLSGDTSRAAFGQSADTEREVILPEGVTVTVVDRGMDQKPFRENADHIFERAAANHDLPPSVLYQQDVSSGAAAHVRNAPLRRARMKRILVLRGVERAIAQIQSAVNENDLPEYKFSADGWVIDYAEVQQQLTEDEQDQVFETRRRLGLTNTLAEIRKRNPDLRDDDAAETVLKDNVHVETMRIQLMKELIAASGSMGASTEDVNSGGKKPFEANRGKPDPGDDDGGGGAAPARAA
jgi:hypothetical protein